MTRLDSKTLIEHIEHEGWAHVSGHVGRDDVERALDVVHKSWVEPRPGAQPTSYLVKDGDPFIWDLHNHGLFPLSLFLDDALIETVLKHFLNDPYHRHIPTGEPNYILRTLIARQNLKPLPLHIDSFVPSVGAHPFVFQVSLTLEDATHDNGCMMVVPGSHQSGHWAAQEDLKDAVPIETKAGDLIIWDSRTWHATAANPSGRSRWCVIATFTRWWLKQGFDITGTLSEEIYRGLTPAQRAVMGFCSMPPTDPQERIDMKQGWEDLSDDVRAYRR